MKELKGIPASPGVVVGKVFFLVFDNIGEVIEETHSADSFRPIITGGK